jgi:hypothetical protein
MDRLDGKPGDTMRFFPPLLLFWDDVDTGLWNISLHCKGNQHHLYYVGCHYNWLLLVIFALVTGPAEHHAVQCHRHNRNLCQWQWPAGDRLIFKTWTFSWNIQPDFRTPLLRQHVGCVWTRQRVACVTWRHRAYAGIDSRIVKDVG